MEEKNLIEKCKLANYKAQNELFNLYKAKMFGTCRRYVSDRQFAEDILIEAFTKVFINIKQFRHNGSFEGWVRRIVINECLMHIRKNKKRQLYDSLDNQDYPLNLIDKNTDIVSDITIKEILKLVKQLPQGYRTIFNLYIIEGYKHREIAELLNISINTSKSQLILARKKMVLLYKEQYN